MSESDTFSSYTVVEPINDDTPLPDLNSLLGILKRMRDCEGADGLPWPENDVSPGRRVSLARTERALVGLLPSLPRRRWVLWENSRLTGCCLPNE
ncbi:hypothetical protein [Stenotrophomonas sp. Br8]|uniref:hypothetical protein n=1 Tax=Stenotrophomonas sp. Br8 TaxID=2759658 RepID=UPI001CC66C87|nr:hypothetical protein [Stenotrophomonas sp. Br8]